MNELVTPELEVGIFNKFDESNEKAPWVRSVNYQAFQQNPEKIRQYHHNILFYLAAYYLSYHEKAIKAP